MNPSRRLPAKDRPGKHAWLGPISLCLGVVGWAIPAGGLLLALGAIACGIASTVTLTEYRQDWTAVAGICAGTAQVLVSVLLMTMA